MPRPNRADAYEPPLSAAEQRALDREGLEVDDLSAELAGLADADADVDRAFTARVMSGIDQRDESIWARLRASLVAPGGRRFSAFTAVPVAVAVALFGFMTTRDLLAHAAAEDAHVTIDSLSDLFATSFELNAPGAQSVALAADFNSWSTTSVPLQDDDGDGVWRIDVSLKPGVYTYMFVVDGTRWVVDSTAKVLKKDGYRGTNAVRHL